MNISIIQFSRTNESDPNNNFNKLLNIINSNKDLIDKCDIVVLPENWICKNILDENYWIEVGLKLSEYLIDKIIVLGSAYIRKHKDILSMGFVSRNGKMLLHYEKIFPSHAVNEDKIIKPGKTLGILNYNGYKFGFLICVDVMYPELVRYLKIKHNIHILINPANISSDRLDLWRSIGIARAFENHIYFIGINLTNSKYPNGRIVKGGSFIVSPNGYIIESLGEVEDIRLVSININEIFEAENRRKFVSNIKHLISMYNLNFIETYEVQI